MTDTNGGGDVDPVEIMLSALADADADVRNGLYERGNAFSQVAQAAALTAIATKLLSDSAEGREILADVAAKHAQQPSGPDPTAGHAGSAYWTSIEQQILNSVQPPIRQVNDGDRRTFTYPVPAEAWRDLGTGRIVQQAILRALPPSGARLVGDGIVGVLAPDRDGARRICEVTDEDCDFVLVTLVYSVPQAPDRAGDGHHHVWLSDDRCATPRCGALKGAVAVAEEAP